MSILQKKIWIGLSWFVVHCGGSVNSVPFGSGMD